MGQVSLLHRAPTSLLERRAVKARGKNLNLGRRRSEGNNRRPGKETIVFSGSSEKVTTSTSRNFIHMLKLKQTLDTAGEEKGAAK